MLFSGAQLASISKTLESGHAIWAVLTANEYLAENDPLRLGIASKACADLRAIKFNQPEEALLKQVMEGEKLANFSAQNRERLRGLDQKLPRQKKQHAQQVDFCAALANKLRDGNGVSERLALRSLR